MNGGSHSNSLTLMLNALRVQARINKDHHILEIGCGWGSLAVEVVKKTGCKYTGITLSERQLQYIEAKVKEAGLQVITFYLVVIYTCTEKISHVCDSSSYKFYYQDQIEVLLCDYRQLPKNCRYDRIISW